MTKSVVRKNFYRDSIQLLKISEEAKKIPGVLEAAVVMGTETNKEILEKLGLLTEEARISTENDMVVSLRARSEAASSDAIKKIEEMLMKPSAAERAFYSLDAALKAMPDANLAIVSIPGEHARGVVIPLLERGVNVHLFSDHVPVEDELELKKIAKQRGLLVMGPGAGTSIINNVAVAFADVVNKGPIGIVAAAGTGLQEVSVLVSQAGSGVSQAIGVGGGDVKKSVGGIMTLEGIKALEADPETNIITLVSKPPDAEVQVAIMDYVKSECIKSYVTCFVGGETIPIGKDLKERVRQTKTLHAAALESIRAVDEAKYSEAVKLISIEPDALIRMADKISAKLAEEQRYLRGLYTGGTLMYETMILLREAMGDIYSNAPLDKRLILTDPYKSSRNTVVDLGEEEYTKGRAHPMMDPTVRRIRLVNEASDPEVAVIMMDFVLGYGSHADPAGAHVEAIQGAQKIAEKGRRYLPILAHVCGTDKDPQNLAGQVERLQRLGVTVLPTNALVALLAWIIAAKGEIMDSTVRRMYKEYLSAM
ncbi:MAG: hypothetical protein ACETV0_07425 [Nitrososphaeria archaeon]